MDRDKGLFWAFFALTVLIQVYASSDMRQWLAWPLGDIISHIMYGALIFLFLVIFLHWKPTDALLGVLAWQILWEASEMIEDRVSNDVGVFSDHLFLDGIKDTAMNLLGGLIGWVLWYPVREREMFERRLARLRLWVYLMGVTMLPMVVIGTIWYLYTGISHDHFAVVWLLVTMPLVTLAAKFMPFQVERERRTHKNKPLTS